MLAALNTCGYDQDLTISDAVRSKVRAEVQKNLLDSPEAEAARTALCEFYQGHVASSDPNRNLSQYISLALYVDGPPHFLPRTKEEDLPPDASAIALFGKLLEPFYEKAGLHSIWERHRNDYAAAMKRYHEPLHKMVFDTEIYLKLAFVAISGAEVHDLSGLHGFAERDGCAELRDGLLRGRVSGPERAFGRSAEVGAEDGTDPAHVSALRNGSAGGEALQLDQAAGTAAAVGEARAAGRELQD